MYQQCEKPPIPKPQGDKSAEVGRKWKRRRFTAGGSPGLGDTAVAPGDTSFCLPRAPGWHLHRMFLGSWGSRAVGDEERPHGEILASALFTRMGAFRSFLHSLAHSAEIIAAGQAP